MTFLPDQFDAAFVTEVRTRRLDRNWTQSELARRTNGVISASTLAGYESGHRRIRLEAAWVLAAALEMKLSTLIERAEKTMVRSDGTRLAVDQLLRTSDPLLEPVRRWLTIAYPEADGPHTTIALTGGALSALSTLMGVATAECHRTLAPYLSSSRPPVTAPTTGMATAIGMTASPIA